MSPTSLIFVVVIAIWATYLSLYAVRRREQLSTARSVDRFSAHMRVLQRRSGRSVPRGQRGPSSGNTRTSILAAGARYESRGHAPQGAGSRGAGAAAGARPAAARAADGGVGFGRVRPTAAFALWGSVTAMNGRMLRAGALLAAAGLAVLGALAATFGVVSWALPVLAVTVSGGLLAWVQVERRAAAVARRRAEVAARIDGAGRADGGAAAHEAAAHEAAAHEAAAQAVDTDAWEQERVAVADLDRAADREPVAESGRSVRRPVSSPDVPFDLDLFTQAPAAPVETPAPVVEPAVAPAGAEDGAVRVALEVASEWESEAAAWPAGLDPSDPLVVERSWEPVPVPAPTYTLKARAYHPVAPEEASGVPVPIEVEDDFEDVFWSAGRRVVNG